MGNNVERGFDIHLAGVKKDSEVFEYQIGKEFFENFDQEILETGNLQVKAEIQKSHAMITVHFDIKGTVELTCDRTLKKFDEPLNIQKSMYFKFGEKDEELDVDLYQIEYDTMTLNLAKYLMECILVEVPFRVVHPDHRDNEESDDESGEVFFSSGNDDSNDDEDTDPRWAGLRDLKDRLN